MEEPVARRLRSRDSGDALANEPRRTAFGDASNRLGKDGNKAPAVKRTRTTRSSAVAESNRSDSIKTRRGRSTVKSNEAEPGAVKPARRSSSRIKSSAEEKSDKAAAKETKKGGTKRTSKETAETKTTHSAKKAKTEAVAKKPKAKAAANAPRRSTRNSRDKPSPRPKPFVLEEVPIIQASARRLIPKGFGLTREVRTEEAFTHGIAYYDEKDRDDTLLCKGYVTDLFQNMFEAETRTQPHPYMDSQEDINSKMRAILVDWLVEVHMKFRLNPNTLYLCVNIIDRYCSKIPVKRSKLQLVGVTALLVACKHEEIYPPEVRDCVYITDRAYTRQEVLDMEQSILRELNWRISVPTAHPFLHRYLSLINASERVGHAAQYYLERSLQEHDMLNYRPSEVCCAAVILAANNPDIRLLDDDEDRILPGVPKILIEYTGFDEDELMDICEALVSKVACESVTASKRKLTAVKKKFESSKYLRIASEAELPSTTHL